MIKSVPLETSDTSEEAVIRFNCVNLKLCVNALSNVNEEQDVCEVNKVKEELCTSPAGERKVSAIVNGIIRSLSAKVSLMFFSLFQQSLPDDNSHPAQIQQWLQQISAETETEPSVGEPKHFVVLNNSATESS